MALHHSPRIVTSGLVLALDTADRNSYAGSGTTWSDLSGNVNNGTLTGGVTYDSGNGGSLVFNGSTGYINCNNITSLGSNPASSFTVSAWVKKTGNSIYQSVIEKYQGITISGVWGWIVMVDYPNINDISLYLNRSQQAERIISYTGSTVLSTWCNIVFVYDGSNGYLYVNGVYRSQGATVNGTVNNRNVNIGRLSVNNGQYFSGNISNVLGYSRALSSTEIQQNYNASKGRFGL